MSFKMKATAVCVALAVSGLACAANTGGFATTTGGNVSGAMVKSAKTLAEMNAAVAAAKSAKQALILTYTGNEDSLINQIVKDHTVDSSGSCPKAHWYDTYREVQIKDFPYGLTIQGANGSSANFGITMIKSSNIIIKNMKIGALGGAKNDADMLRIDNSQNVLIDHNELFAVNNECKGSPDGDLTFESAIDIKKDAQNITVSYNVIRDSKKVGLMGHTQSNGTTDFQRTVTFHHNIYSNVNGRLPLQRGGVMHAYNNFYDQITGTGINVRANGKAVVENNWFQNSKNPITCRFDTNGCGKWYLKGNNTTSAASNATYGITWDSPGTGGINADSWTSTLSAKPSLPYSYEPVSAQCVKDKLASYAGVGKNGATLAASACSGSSSSASSSTSSSAASSSSSSVATSPVKLSASVSGSSINLSWTAPSGTLGGMQVYRDTDSNPSGRVRLASLASTVRSYTDSTAAAGTTYYYWIKTSVNGSTVNSDAASAKIGTSSSSSSAASSSAASSSAASSSTSGAPTLSGTGDYPSGWSKCADLGATCTAKSSGWVAFGRKGKWVTKYVGSGKSIACTVAAFGSDPAGNPNKCSTM